MKRFLVGGLVVALLLCLVMASVWARDWPITGSQVITLERGPDGLWLSQAWVVEWQVHPEWRPAAIYDVWRRSDDGALWHAATRQVDVSITWEPQAAKKPLTITAGRRWHLGQDGQGPAWVYGTVSIGW